jgi:hypothetical protein
MLSLDLLHATFKASAPLVLQISSTRFCITIEGKIWDMDGKTERNWSASSPKAKAHRLQDSKLHEEASARRAWCLARSACLPFFRQSSGMEI